MSSHQSLPPGRVQLSFLDSDMQVINHQPTSFRVPAATLNADTLLPQMYAKGSETSKLAAEQNSSRGNDIARILEYLAYRIDGATCDEIETALGMSHQTASARCRDLKRNEFAVTRIDQSTGKTVRRPTRTGRLAEVLFIAEA